MKYLWLVVIGLAAWALVDYLLAQQSGPDRVPTTVRLKGLGRQVHHVVGWLAVVILIILAVRLFVQTVLR